MGRRSLADTLLNRTTTTANTPVPFAGRAQSYGVFGQRRDAETQMRAMTATGTLFAIVDRTSNATALVDWKLWRKAKSGKKEDRVEVTSHAALDLWNRPNPFMPRQEFVETSTQHYDLTGETEWVIARKQGVSIPLEMWPVRPDRMAPVPDRDRFLRGWVYTSPDGEQIPLELDEVIQLRRPNPLDPYRGLSPVLSILPDLDTGRYAAEWSRAFFLNSAQPGGIIEVPVHLQDHEFDEMRERWAEQHKGVANAHKVAIVEYGAKWSDRTISQRDMQFVELRGATRDAIREAYGIPKFAVGDLEDVNRAVAEAAKAWFAEQLTVPRLERIKGALNNELLPMYGPTATGLEFDYENPVPPDVTTEAEQLTARSNAAAVLVQAGFEAKGTLSAVGLPDIAFVGPARAPAGEPSAAWQAAVAGLTGGGDGGEIEAAMRWEAVAKIDENTCLAPEVRVTTRAGLVPAKDVTLDDELLTHTGRWVQPSRIVVSQVEEQLTRVHLADGRSLRLTWDHPVFVHAGDGFAWRNAGDLAVGDLVVDQSSLELGEEVWRVDLFLGQTPDGVSPAGDVGGLPAVDVRALGVPVRAVRFDDEPVTDKEVGDPGAYLDLGAVGVPQVFEGLSDAALDAGLGVAGAVAADGAVPRASDGRRDDAEAVSAVCAGDDDGRPSAGLGAVLAGLRLAVAEGGSAAGALCASAPGVDAARAGAVVVPGGVADRDAELGVAVGAGLGDSAPLGLGRYTPGDVLGVGVHALSRAVSLAGPTPARDLTGAGLAHGRREVRVVLPPRGLDRAAEAEGPSLDRRSAVRTRLIHGQSVQVTAVQIRAVEQELHVGEVYDFTIPGDETFWAEGVLVHNCGPCADNDGQTYRNRAAAYKDYPGGSGYVHCVGAEFGNECRCKVVKRRKTGDDE